MEVANEMHLAGQNPGRRQVVSTTGSMKSSLMMSIFHRTKSRLDAEAATELRRNIHEVILILAPWVVLLLLLR